MDIPLDLRDECGDVLEADVVEVMAGLLFHRDYPAKKGPPVAAHLASRMMCVPVDALEAMQGDVVRLRNGSDNDRASQTVGHTHPAQTVCRTSRRTPACR